MHQPVVVTAAVGFAFGIAGLVKGVAGMGLPVVSIGLLGTVMPPANAAALTVVPALVTNAWQFWSGPHARRLIIRLWPMLGGCAFATVAAAGLIVGSASGGAAAALGAVLVLYAVIGLVHLRLFVAPRFESWLSPAIGVATGIVAGATGVFTIPAVPYLEAIGLEREDLVQALGLFFMVSSTSLAVGLASRGAFHVPLAGASALCLLPTALGMRAGRWIRMRIRPQMFRVVFLIFLIGLGVNLLAHSVG